MTKPLDHLLQNRHSVRAFTSQPVSRSALEHMCQAARLAPSSANLQPGSFHVLTGNALGNLTDALRTAHQNGTPISSEYSYFPTPLPAHLKARQRAAGYALYYALKIQRRDIPARRAQLERNYMFFGAPVGVVVTIDPMMGKGCFMDLGMAIMAFLLSAVDQGMGATAIGAMANHAPIIRDMLGLPDDEMVVCGIAVGYEDRTHPANGFRTEREALENYSSFRGFPDS